MIRAVLLLALGGCVTTAAVARKDHVTVPIFLGAIAADLVITPLIALESLSPSTTGAIGMAIGVTAVDIGLGCVLGACSAIKP